MGKSWELASPVNFDLDNLPGGRPHPNPPPEGEGILWFSGIILLIMGLPGGGGWGIGESGEF